MQTYWPGGFPSGIVPFLMPGGPKFPSGGVIDPFGRFALPPFPLGGVNPPEFGPPVPPPDKPFGRPPGR